MRTASRYRTRRGSITLAWLVVYSIVLILLVWAAQQLSWRTHARAELQNAEDAAAHAAARTLLTEAVFARDYADPSTSSVVPIDRAALIASARAEGERLARLNRVLGRPLVLKDNPNNLTDKELYAGTLGNPASRTFVGLANVGVDPFHPDLNAVRVKAHRTRVGASSTYYLDRDVIGFRLKMPPASSPAFPAIPMVPIAILSDPCPPDNNLPACWGTKDKSTWEGAIMARKGQDHWSLNAAGVPVHGDSGDGIKEITVTLGEHRRDRDDHGHDRDDHREGRHNGRLVYFDTGKVGSVDTLLAQIQNGITYADLPENNGQLAGQFLLNPADSVPAGTPAEANVASPATGPLPSGSASRLAKGNPQQSTAGLQGILGQPRIWMLYSQIHAGSPSTVHVIGFVVARVMSVTADGETLRLVLQPSVLVTDTAVTDWTLRDLGPRSLYNPYVARLRFVE
jgi:hypothetical protein